MRILCFMFCVCCLFASCTTRDRKGYEYHNPDIARMSWAQLEQVAKNTKCSDCRYDALHRLFHRCKEAGTLYTLYDFAKKFPHTEFVDSALAIVIPKSDSLYAVAVRLNTIDAWSDFVVRVPVDLQRDALARLDSLRWETQKHKWDTDDKAWEQATRLNQLIAYDRYLSLYPDGAHAGQAVWKKAEIEELYWGRKHRNVLRQVAYEERQRQLRGDIRNVGVWSVVDSLIALYGYPHTYHYEAVGNSDIYRGEMYAHTYAVGKDKTLSDLKKIYLKDYYKLWQNKHFNILIQFKWKAQNITVQHSRSAGHQPESQLNDNGTITRLPSYKSVYELAKENNKGKSIN